MINKYALIRVVDSLVFENKELTMSDISKKAKTSIAMTKIILDYLEKKGVIKRNKINNKTSLFILADNFLTRQIRVLRIILDIHNARLIEELREKYGKNLLSVVLFGSCADGTCDNKSDLDILVISRKKDRYASLKSESRTGRELNILLYSLREWKNKAKRDHVFYERVISNNTVLYGENPIVI